MGSSASQVSILSGSGWPEAIMIIGLVGVAAILFLGRHYNGTRRRI